MGLTNLFFGQLMPVMLKSESWGPRCNVLHIRHFYAPALYLTPKIIPETKGKSLEEIEASWKTKAMNE